MKVRTRLLGLLAVVTLMAGLLPLTAFATQQQEYPTKRCYEEVTEVKYQRPIYKTKFEYVKQVKGKVQKDIDPRGGHEIWVTVGAFDWEVWSGNSTQWSFDDVEILEQGSHNAIQAVWEEEINNITWKFRKRTTDYRYVKSGNTQQVQVDTETSDWLPEGQMPDGDGWVEIDRKTVKGDEIPCEDDLIDNPGFSFGHETLVCDPETGEFDAQADGFITLNEGANYSWDGESQTGLSAGNFGPFIATASEGFTFAEGKTFSTGAINILAISDHEECDKFTTPVVPEVTESGKCETEGFFVIPDTEGVIYLVDGEAKGAGTVITGPGTFEVTAQAAEGYELTDPEWSMGITLEAGEPCPSTTPSTLPFTGVDTGTMALAALVLTGLGGLILALSRKPEEDGIN